MVSLVAGYVHLVDHALDEEETPAPGRLDALQLGLDVRRVPVLPGRRAAPSVGYAHQEVAVRGEDLQLHGQLRPVLVAVLHRVHRRFGHGGLETLQVLTGETEP